MPREGKGAAPGEAVHRFKEDKAAERESEWTRRLQRQVGRVMPMFSSVCWEPMPSS